MLITAIADLGSWTLAQIRGLGRATLLLFSAGIGFWGQRRRVSLLVQQLASVGVASLLIVAVSGLFIGMVLGLQGYSTLSRFGADEALGQLTALALLRELGPVVTALLFAGRAGSAVTAEIGLMKSTDQLAAMSLLGVDPVYRIVGPRFWAGLLALPLLAAIFNAVAIGGAYLVGVRWLGVDLGPFWSSMQGAVELQGDVLNGVWKSVIFAWLVSWIAVYQGYHCVPTAAGVARATTRTVVGSSLVVLAADFLLTTWMYGV